MHWGAYFAWIIECILVLDMILSMIEDKVLYFIDWREKECSWIKSYTYDITFNTGLLLIPKIKEKYNSRNNYHLGYRHWNVY